MRCPGIEPGPSAWKADILTTRPTTRSSFLLQHDDRRILRAWPIRKWRITNAREDRKLTD